MATEILCQAEDCDKPAKTRGYCSKHYQRLLKTGETKASGTEPGAARKWVEEVAIPHSGDECLIFPFFRNKQGYGRVSNRAGGPSLVHVIVADACLGPRPTPQHEVCHNCGRGHHGCVNPKHLRWGTRAENVADRKTHGVFVAPPTGYGEKASHAILTPEQVLSIRLAFASGATLASVATRYGVSISCVHAVKLGKSWPKGPWP